MVAVAICGMSGAFTPACVGAVPSETTAHRARGALGSGPRGTAQRAADRMLARRVRGAIRADAFLALAAPVVKVTSNRGVVRLVGRVRTDKERSSIAFKAAQIARVGGVDDRVTVGDRIEAAAPQREDDSMKAATLVGILLVLLGAAALVYQGFTYTTREKILDIGPIVATRETRKTIPLPPVLGGMALVGGIALIGLGARRS
jgi:BON domain